MESLSWRSSIKEYGLLLVIGLAGLGILGYGIYLIVWPEKPVVEVVKQATDKDENLGVILVDVSGAVIKPGVYKLANNSRIGDALVATGGLAAEADRAWVATTLNLAEPIKDGQKIYIPVMTEGASINMEGRESRQSGKVNINKATQEELEKLSGIGATRAKAIIDNRPYGSTEEVVTKAKIPQTVYDKIKDSIALY